MTNLLHFSYPIIKTQKSSNAQTLARYGEAFRLQQRYDAAQEKFKKAINISPNYAWAYAHLGETYRQWGQPDNHYREAIEAFEKAISLDSSYAWAHAHLGETYREMKEYDKAEERFNAAIKIDENLVWAHAHRGANFYERGKYDEAIESLKKAIDYASVYPWAKVYLAMAYVQKKDYEQAFYYYTDAIVQDPSVVKSAAKDYGLLSLYQRDYEKSLVFFKQALQENPSDIETHYYTATVTHHLKGPDEAQPFINKVNAALQSKQLSTLVELNETYIKGGLAALKGNTDEAWGHVKEALRENSNISIKAAHDPAYEQLRQKIFSSETTEH